MKKSILIVIICFFVCSAFSQITDTGDEVGIGTSSPNYKLDISDTKENGILQRHLTTVGVAATGNKTWTYKIGREYDYPNRTIEFGMFSPSYGSNPSFYVETPNDYGRLATFLTSGGVDDTNEHNWTITLGREYDFPNRTIDFGMVSNNHGTNPAFFIAPKGIEAFRVTESGNVGIGTTTTGSHKLAVEGSIGAREIKVEASGWSDFVFENSYELRTLEETEKFIAANNHLPEIPSEEEVTENGINLGEMDAKLLQKIEELTLYMIDLNKQVKSQNERTKQLEWENSELKKEVNALKNK